MAEHPELVAELEVLGRLSTPERLKRAQERRAQQLKKWAQEERETSGEERKRRRKRRRTRRKSSQGKSVTFPANVRLLEAAARRDVEEVREFLERGISPDLCNEDGLTALHQSSIDAASEVVLALLEGGADVNARDSELWTPLHAAATCGHLNLVQLLIQRGADLLAVNSDGNMAYDLCEDEATLECLESAMAERGITQEKIEEARSAPERAMIREILELLQAGADLDAPRDHGATLLHIAAANGYAEAAELLLENRAGVGARDEDGWEPLHAAACWVQVPLLELLVAHGADPDAKSRLDETPLDVCGAEEARAKLLELKEKRAALGRSQDRHNSRLPRRASSAGSRGKLVRRLSQSERSSLFRREQRREAIVWHRAHDAEERHGDAERRHRLPGSARDMDPAPPNGSTLHPDQPESAEAAIPADSQREEVPPTLAALKRHRAAAKSRRSQDDPTGSDPGFPAAPNPGLGDPPLLRLSAPAEEVPAGKQRCCRVM